MLSIYVQAQGVAVPSFTSSLIENNPNPTPEEEDIYKWASTGFYSGKLFIGITFSDWLNHYQGGADTVSHYTPIDPTPATQWMYLDRPSRQSALSSSLWCYTQMCKRRQEKRSIGWSGQNVCPISPTARTYRTSRLYLRRSSDGIPSLLWV